MNSRSGWLSDSVGHKSQNEHCSCFGFDQTNPSPITVQAQLAVTFGSISAMNVQGLIIRDFFFSGAAKKYEVYISFYCVMFIHFWLAWLLPKSTISFWLHIAWRKLKHQFQTMYLFISSSRCLLMIAIGISSALLILYISK